MPGRQTSDHFQGGSMTALFESMFTIIDRQGHLLAQNRRTRRILTAAAVFLLAALLLLAACQSGGNTTPTDSTSAGSTSEATGRPNTLGSFMLAQRVAESINQQDQVTSLFQSIPDSQRQGILLDEYVQYIRLLRRMANGSIASLTRIDDKALAQLLQGLRFGASLKHEGFYFQAGTANDPAQRIAYFQQVSEDGTPYLDPAPIRRALALQNYATLYFDAIDRSDREALAVLIRSSADTPEARLQKADRILTFYHSVVATASPSFRVAMVMPDRITFVESVYENTARTKLGTRRLTIYADGATGFLIDDVIPDTLALSDLAFTSKGQTVLNFGKLQNGQLPVLTSSQMTEIAGRAISHDDTTCKLLANGEHHMIAYYDGIVVEGTGRCDQHQYWRVRVSRITLTSDRFLTASGLGIGQPLNSLLLKYPFADETGGTVTGTLEKYSLKMDFKLDNRAISRITLTFSES